MTVYILYRTSRIGSPDLIIGVYADRAVAMKIRDRRASNEFNYHVMAYEVQGA